MRVLMPCMSRYCSKKLAVASPKVSAKDHKAVLKTPSTPNSANSTPRGSLGKKQDAKDAKKEAEKKPEKKTETKEGEK